MQGCMQELSKKGKNWFAEGATKWSVDVLEKFMKSCLKQCKSKRDSD